MGYLIRYDGAPQKSKRMLVLSVLFFCMFCAVLARFWPQSHAMILTALFGDMQEKAGVIEVFVQDTDTEPSVIELFFSLLEQWLP